MIYVLIAAAKLNGVEPRAWLADVLARIADHSASRLDDLLPWNCKRAQNLAFDAAQTLPTTSDDSGSCRAGPRTRSSRSALPPDESSAEPNPPGKLGRRTSPRSAPSSKTPRMSHNQTDR
ncbi:transposase domain-containing protein [Teichococcus aestuarii]|uniref:transposase domain-containing protein n=1 Tax=Teichococcus aestuarii TaxID=568898 RepID=UPI003615B7A7